MRIAQIVPANNKSKPRKDNQLARQKQVLERLLVNREQRLNELGEAE